MLHVRGPASQLSHLAQRPLLARAALPLLAAYVPEAFARTRALHVFVRAGAHEDFCKVHVHDGAVAGNLKTAVIAELQLDAPPDCVRLLREVEGGGAPVPLDSRRALAEQGVREGSSVVVEVLPAASPPVPPTPPYVLARLSRSQSYTKVALAPGADADDLAKAVIAELKLGVAPSSVCLLREVEGGAPMPLKSLEKLAAQGISEGSRVLVEETPAAGAWEPRRLGSQLPFPLITTPLSQAHNPHCTYASSPLN